MSIVPHDLQIIYVIPLIMQNNDNKKFNLP
jgi:hypothetical protein